MAGPPRTMPRMASEPVSPRGYSPALAPFSVRDVVLPNRIVVSPMCQYSAVDGMVGDWHLVHYGRAALGGAGLVWTEATAVRADGRITPFCAGVWNEALATAWRRIVAFVHAHSAAKIGMQLAHGGRKASCRQPWDGGGPVPSGGWPVIGPSPVPFHDGWPTPRALSRDDMDELRDAFVAAAQRCAQVGFDVLELHMAHGYLLSSFLSPLANHRTDDYGGSLENRARLPLEVLDAVRKVWPERPLFVRLSATDWLDDQGQGFTLAEAVLFARWAKEHGCDVLDVSSGGNSATVLPKQGPLYQVPFAARIRAEAGIPVTAVGRIVDIAAADEVIAAGKADLCAIGRAHLADPSLVLRTANERGFSGQFWPPQYLMGRR